MNSTSWIEISKKNLQHNIAQFQGLTQQVRPFQPAIWAVVKGNAYGHGQKEIVGILNETAAIQGFMVFDIFEALELRKFSSKPLAVLGYIDNDNELIKLAATSNIVLPILNYNDAKRLSALNIPITAQIKIDIGTNRLGIRVEEAIEQVLAITKLPNLKITGLYGHFANSENGDDNFTQRQFDNFHHLITELKNRGVEFTNNHCACSAAALRQDNYFMDSLRLGLGMYGLWPSAASKNFRAQIQLKPVLSWKSQVLQIKKVKSGETIGYGLNYRADADIKIATIPVGYFDGYDRNLSNNSRVIINGKKCPVRGNICMNLMMVELPEQAGINKGSEVILIGSDQDLSITADDLAGAAGTINYEIVTRINQNIPRSVNQI